MPANERYVFTLENPSVCTAVRVLGRQNSFEGNVSCAEIEVYGSAHIAAEAGFAPGKKSSVGRGALGLTYVRAKTAVGNPSRGQD